jgi:alpha-tubulin suppressor-like RCC1 family protein
VVGARRPRTNHRRNTVRIALLLAAALSLASTGAAAQLTWPPIVVKPIKLIPLPPPNPDEFVEITAGYNHTCARKRDGRTFCWGVNDDKQIGIEQNASCTDDSFVTRPCVPRPRFVMNALQVDAGTLHTCALDLAGKAFCWGNNANGALASFPRANAREPLPVAVNGNRTFRSISAGFNATCATSDQGLFCWGAIAGSSSLPIQILANAGYEQVAVGGAHACVLFVLGSFRQAECFGNNALQQTGVDPSTWSGPVPPTFTSTIGQQTNRIAASGDFTCGDKQDGTVRCTGYNGWGQLGAGDFQTTFQARPVGNSMALQGVSTGWNHACALDAAGRAFCWGNGKYGQLGQGNSQSGTFNTPQAVQGGRSYRALAAGFQHTCAIGTDNRIWCWGSNYRGQLGLGSGGGWHGVPMAALDPV